MKRARTRGVFERPARSGVWWIDYTDAQGLRHREKVGPRKKALDAYLARKQQIRDGKFFGLRGEEGVTFREIAEDRMRDGRSYLRPESVRTDEQRLRKILAEFGDRKARTITPEEIERFLARMKEDPGRPRSNATLNRYHALLCKIFRFAHRDRKIPENPMEAVDRRKESEGRVRMLTDDEEGSLRQQIRFLYPSHELEFDLALQTGMRRGEQFGAKPEDVNLESGILMVRGKTGRREVRLNSMAREIVQKLLEAKRPDRVCDPSGGRWFERCLVLAGVKNFRWHDLRHTFASRLVMGGVEIRTVMSLLGHKSIVMTQRYAHLAQGHEAAAVERLARPDAGDRDANGTDAPQVEDTSPVSA